MPSILDAPFPHVFVHAGFGACSTCGLKKDDRDPRYCEHDLAWPCIECPPAHVSSDLHQI